MKAMLVCAVVVGVACGGGRSEMPPPAGPEPTDVVEAELPKPDSADDPPFPEEIADRRVEITYYIRKTNKFHEAVINLSTETLELNVRLGPNLHAPGDGDEIFAIERTALEDEGVQAAIAKLQLPEGSQIVIDPWIYGNLTCQVDFETTTNTLSRRRWS